MNFSFVKVFLIISIGLIIGICKVQADWAEDGIALGGYYDTFIKTLSNCEVTGNDPTVGDEGTSRTFTNSYPKAANLEAFKQLVQTAFTYFSNNLDYLNATRKEDIKKAAVTLCQKINTYCPETYREGNIPLKNDIRNFYVTKGGGDGSVFDTESSQTYQPPQNYAEDDEDEP